jgi:hypothetical protein
MPPSERGGLKAAFTNFNKPDADKEAELKLLGRTVQEDSQTATAVTAPIIPPPRYQVATTQPETTGGLTPRPLLQREPVRQLSFRCPISIAAELRRKAAFNQLEQQEIILEGIKRVLLELADPPPAWES